MLLCLCAMRGWLSSKSVWSHRAANEVQELLKVILRGGDTGVRFVLWHRSDTDTFHSASFLQVVLVWSRGAASPARCPWMLLIRLVNVLLRMHRAETLTFSTGRGCVRIDWSVCYKCNYDFHFQGRVVFVTLGEMFWKRGEERVWWRLSFFFSEITFLWGRVMF